MVYEIGSYQIRPYPNGLSWEIWENRLVTNRETKEKRYQWVSTGSYPSTLSDAISKIIQWEDIKRDGGIRGLKAMKEHIDSLHQEVMSSIKKSMERAGKAVGV